MPDCNENDVFHMSKENWDKLSADERVKELRHIFKVAANNARNLDQYTDADQREKVIEDALTEQERGVCLVLLGKKFYLITRDEFLKNVLTGHTPALYEDECLELSYGKCETVHHIPLKSSALNTFTAQEDIRKIPWLSAQIQQAEWKANPELLRYNPANGMPYITITDYYSYWFPEPAKGTLYYYNKHYCSAGKIISQELIVIIMCRNLLQIQMPGSNESGVVEAFDSTFTYREVPFWRYAPRSYRDHMLAHHRLIDRKVDDADTLGVIHINQWDKLGAIQTELRRDKTGLCCPCVPEIHNRQSRKHYYDAVEIPLNILIKLSLEYQLYLTSEMRIKKSDQSVATDEEIQAALAELEVAVDRLPSMSRDTEEPEEQAPKLGTRQVSTHESAGNMQNFIPEEIESHPGASLLERICCHLQ